MMKVCFADLAKSEEKQKSLAASGLMLGYPVSINGMTHRNDGIQHHVTVKFFEGGVEPHVAHAASKALDFKKINPKTTYVGASKFPTRFGTEVYVLTLHGQGVQHVADYNSKLNNVGTPSKYNFAPHITVDKHTYDYVKSSPGKTAEELNIKFGHPHLKKGPKTLSVFEAQGYKVQKNIPTPFFSNMAIDKSETRNAAIAAMMGAAVAMGVPKGADTAQHLDEGQAKAYQKGFKAHIPTVLRALEQVESAGGRLISHKPAGGMHRGARAFGNYGLMPITIQETILKHPELSGHKKALKMGPNDLHNYMKKNPDLQHHVAQKRVEHLHNLFNGKPEHIAFSWFNGPTATKRAINSGKDISNHWYVQRFMDQYGKLSESQ
jgi:hypothetical protein